MGSGILRMEASLQNYTSSTASIITLVRRLWVPLQMEVREGNRRGLHLPPTWAKSPFPSIGESQRLFSFEVSHIEGAQVPYLSVRHARLRSKARPLDFERDLQVSSLPMGV